MNTAVRRVALGLFIALAAFASWLLRGDGPPPNDADLMALPAPIPDHENGFIALIGAAELLRLPDDDAQAERLRAMAHGAAWDDALVQRALAENEFALHAFARIARDAAFQSPADSSGSRDAVAAIDLARLLATRAIAAARRDDPDAAIEDALLVVQTGTKVGANSNGGLLYAEMGFAIGEIGLRAIEVMSPNLSLTSTRAVALARALRAERAAPEPWRAALAADYRRERATFTPLSGPALDGAAARIAAWLPRRYVFQPNNTWAERITRVRLQQARADQPCDVPLAGLVPLSFSDLLRPNALGRRRAMTIAARDRIEISRCAYDARVELTRAALGVLAFERERGVLPPALDALVPAYLDPAPTDPFSGASLRFDRAHRVIYSIGSDGVDEGGRELAGADATREPRLALPAVASD